MTILGTLVGSGIVTGLVYHFGFAHKVWMKKFGDGVYNPKIKFNKKNLNVKNEVLGYKVLTNSVK